MAELAQHCVECGAELIRSPYIRCMNPCHRLYEARTTLARKLVEAVSSAALPSDRPHTEGFLGHCHGINDALAAMARVLKEEKIELVAKDGEGAQ